METHDPDDWNDLYDACDGKVECNVVVHGGTVVSCDAPYTADYAEIFYECLSSNCIHQQTSPKMLAICSTHCNNAVNNNCSF